MNRYAYEFEIFECEGAWCAFPIGLDGATQGLTRAEAIENAADWLYIMAEDAEIWGKELPAPVFGTSLNHGGERLVVSVIAGREFIETVNLTQAAQLLGMGEDTARKMLECGLLEGWSEGSETRITLNSVIARRNGN